MEEKIYASLAPMAGYTDTVFRRICGSFGATEATSEMISAVALTYGDEKTGKIAKISDGEPPTRLQIFGHDADIMARAAEILLTGSFPGCSYAAPPCGIDINMGCPVRKVCSSGDGSALMSDIPLAGRIVSAVKNVCEKHGVELSVKFRLGINDREIVAPEFAVAMAESGADMLTLHCRTKEQMYMPSARREYCRTVRDTLDEAGFGGVPLIGNGDVQTRADAEEYISLGCSGVAIGRAALGDPWLFSAISEPETYAPPTIEERVEMIEKYVSEVIGELGEERGIRESRSRAAYLLRGVRGGAKVRDALNREETLRGFIEELEKILR